ncbi:MAG: cyclodeaminase/cyclohydrolase family protein, partial [Clostridia bacterium]|nr:cyclodeaminase/cyclohydrolase family protein [Clostridia bacterium]
ATCSYGINHIQPLVPPMYAYVASDAEIGIALLKSVIENSVKNVYANTNLIKDDRLREQLEAQAKGYLM